MMSLFAGWRYWRDLESASSQDLQQYLEELDALHYFSGIHPIVSKKLKACAAVYICEEEQGWQGESGSDASALINTHHLSIEHAQGVC